jgi:hypothetical protein
VPHAFRARARALTIVAIIVCGCAAGVAVADAPLTQSQAHAAARRAASHYVERFGISIAPGRWAPSCSRVTHTVFACRVYADTLQCAGRLTVYRSAGLVRARQIAIACGE